MRNNLLGSHLSTRVLLRNGIGLCLAVFVMHYVFDEPTRSPLMRRAMTSASQVPILNVLFHASEGHSTAERSDADPLPDSRWLLTDSSFELWREQPYPVLDKWVASLTVGPWDVIKKETSVIKAGRASVRLECDGLGHCANLRQEVPKGAVERFLQHTIRFSVWALSTTPGSPCVHINDGRGVSSACLERNTGKWQPFSVERVISPEATRVLFIIDMPESSPLYVDEASVVAEAAPSVQSDGDGS